MLKAILTTTILVSLTASALADEATYRIDYGSSSLFVSDNTCGEISSKTPQHADRLKICARPAEGKRVRLEVDRHVRDKADEKEISVVVIVAPGATFDLLDAKLSVKVQ